MSLKFLRRSRQSEPERTSEWPAPSGRKRVVVEYHDGAELHVLERILTEAGYEVATCMGPDPAGRQVCPLPQGGECPLVCDADLVVHGLRITQPENQAVLRAIRDRHPDVRVMVEVPATLVEPFHATLEGCRVVPFPVNSESLVGAAQELAPTS